MKKLFLIDKLIHPKNFSNRLVLARSRALVAIGLLAFVCLLLVQLLVIKENTWLILIASFALLMALTLFRLIGNIMVAAALVLLVLVSINTKFYQQQLETMGVINPQVMWLLAILVGGTFVGGFKLVLTNALISLIAFNSLALNQMARLSSSESEVAMVHFIEMNLVVLLVVGCSYFFESFVMKMAEATESAFKRLETQELKILESSRLKFLGEMAGGVAHEINNPLGVMLGNTNILETLIDKADLDKSLRDGCKQRLEKIIEMVLRIDGIVKSLSRLSAIGIHNEVHRDTSVTEIIHDVCRLFNLQNYTQKDAWRVDVENGLIVRGHTTLLGQVFVDLISTAVNALMAGDRQKSWIHIKAYAESGVALVEIEFFNGKKFQQDLARIKDPFFSFQESISGQGLGLSIAHSIVRQHGGDLDVSVRDEVCLYRLSLPMKESPILPSDQAAPSPSRKAS